jgi:16S rRNA (cytosine1402-N4)-methyltransferase
MVSEALAGLDPKSGGAYIDCTVGGGGHSLAVLETAPDIRVMGIDLDGEARRTASLRLAEYGNAVDIVEGNFRDVEQIADEHGFNPADGVLFDLGLSSIQVDTAVRGFSLRQEARLDMRFDTAQKLTAHELVNRRSADHLADLIFRLGEEPRARRIARAVVRNRPVETTTALAEIVEGAVGRAGGRRIHPATRTFQALRMAVNSELENLRQGLAGAIRVLRRAGRLVVISYHSLEDRVVKTTLRREAADCVCPPKTPVCACGHEASLRLVHRRVIRPDAHEVTANPRARSARLRTAERI